MKTLIIVFVVTIISGCAATAAPTLVNGKYYMAGDPTCARARPLSSSRIMCYTEKGKETGYLDAMTDQQLQMYQFNQQQAQQALQQALQGLQQQAIQRPTYTNCYNTFSGVNCTTY